MENVKVKTRNIFIDCLKGILITLVVIGHLQYFEYDSRTLTLIYSFHMPAFLIVYGILSYIDKNTTISHIIIKKVKSILLPYFIFYLISLIIIPVNTFEMRTKSIIAVFKGIGDPINAVNLPLWFLTYYFVATTIFDIIEYSFYKLLNNISLKTKSKNIIYNKEFLVHFFSSIAIFILMYISYVYARVYKGVRLPFNIEISLFSLGFILFGKILTLFYKNFSVKIKQIIKKNNKLKYVYSLFAFLIIVIIISLWYYLSMKNGRIDLNARDYKNALYMYIDAFLGFIIISFFSYLISLIPILKNIVSYVGKNSIYILAYHIPSYLVTYNIIIPLLPISFSKTLATNSITSVLFFTSCGVLISLFFSIIHKLLNNNAYFMHENRKNNYNKQIKKNNK